MTYEEWERQVPLRIREDPLWEMQAYRLALFLYDLAWDDCDHLVRDRRGQAIAEQMIRSAGSICANIEEGYGRGFGKQYAQFLGYSLGSARETRGWYYRSRRLLSSVVVQERCELLSQIAALVIVALNQQKGHR